MGMGAPTAMTMGPRHMTTDVLTLSQLLSPSFPVGAFAYSHGLETAIQDGAITSAVTLEAWIFDLLHYGGLRSDAVFLNMAYQAGKDDIPIIEAQARAFSASAERLKETDLQGAAFCNTVRAVWGLELGRLCYPVALGQAVSDLGLDAQLATAIYLQAFVGNLCSVALRLVPLGQVDGQKIQAALKPNCAEIAKHCQGATLDDVHNSAWMSDIASMRHETQYSRIFRT